MALRKTRRTDALLDSAIALERATLALHGRPGEAAVWLIVRSPAGIELVDDLEPDDAERLAAVGVPVNDLGARAQNSEWAGASTYVGPRHESLEADVVVIECPDPRDLGRRMHVVGDMTVGRLATLSLRDPGLHRAHVRFAELDGRLWVFDLSTAWGTSVNGERVVRQPLRDGDRVSLAASVLELIDRRATVGSADALDAAYLDVLARLAREGRFDRIGDARRARSSA